MDQRKVPSFCWTQSERRRNWEETVPAKEWPRRAKAFVAAEFKRSRGYHWCEVSGDDWENPSLCRAPGQNQWLFPRGCPTFPCPNKAGRWITWPHGLPTVVGEER